MSDLKKNWKKYQMSCPSLSKNQSKVGSITSIFSKQISASLTAKLRELLMHVAQLSDEINEKH